MTVLRNASPNYMVQDLCIFLTHLGVEIDGIGTTTLRIHGVENINTDVEFAPSEDPIEAMSLLTASDRDELGTDDQAGVLCLRGFVHRPDENRSTGLSGALGAHSAAQVNMFAASSRRRLEPCAWKGAPTKYSFHPYRNMSAALECSIGKTFDLVALAAKVANDVRFYNSYISPSFLLFSEWKLDVVDDSSAQPRKP